MQSYFEIRYHTVLLLITIACLPFFLIGIAAIFDLVREAIALAQCNENPFGVLSCDYTSNSIGLSRNVLLTAWPLFILAILCLRIWVSPNNRGNLVFLGAAAIVSLALPVFALLGNYAFQLWAIPLALFLYLIAYKVIRENQE